MVQGKQRERATNRGAGEQGEREVRKIDGARETEGESNKQRGRRNRGGGRNRWCKRNRGRKQQTEGQEKQGEREVRKIDSARETEGERSEKNR